jgi:aryl-alcohol dehydrogenase-like predicted oxidoreductase
MIQMKYDVREYGAEMGISSLSHGGTEIPRRRLGRTGEIVSLVGLGGFHLGMPDLSEPESIRIIRTAIDRGINFLDNSWDYQEGRSEIRMGKALRNGYREKAFLMTKIDGRNRGAAARQIEESLQRLQTDYIDLLQFHEIIYSIDPDRIFGAGGAMEAIIEAKEEGTIRYIGFTGHKSPDIHLKMLDMASRHGFRFDTVQMPLNVMDAHFESFEQKVLPVLTQDGIGILGMKPMGNGHILESHAATPIECLHYAMNLPVSVVIAGCDSMANLDQALAAAWSFQPLDSQEIQALLARTADTAQYGTFEPYKTTHRYDSTFSHPHWLG